MRDNILVDTSIWIEYFNRPESKAGARLEKLIKEGDVCSAGVILTELLQGAKIEKEFNAILESFIVLPFLNTTIDTWIRAGKISFSLRRKGITIPTTDLIIASLAMEHGCSVFTIDPHFEKIPDLKLFTN
jgi:predicted nucleic acid-binding protein